MNGTMRIIPGNSVDSRSDHAGLAIAAALIGVAGLALVTRAQESLIRFGDGVTLRAVEQGTEDVGPLARSARISRVDLRMPTGFDRVYRLESPTLGSDSPARYARVSGALIAIFPRSEYQTTAAGTSIMVPPGTIYAIGSGSAASAVASRREITPSRPAPLDLRESTRMGTRVDTRVDTVAHAGPPEARTRVQVDESASAIDRPRPDQPGPEPAPARSIWGDERYRVARVAALLNSVTAR